MAREIFTWYQIGTENLRKIYGLVGKENMEEALEHLSGTCKIYSSWYCEIFQGQHTQVRSAHPQYARPGQVLNSTFEEGRGV